MDIQKQNYTVIVPTLNAQTTLYRCLSAIKEAREDVEVIIVDGGSRDLTILIAKEFGARIRQTEPSRGLQMNCGVELAAGDILLFLHADTLLPRGAFNVLDDHFQHQKNKISTFRLKFDHDHWLLKSYGKFTKFDSLWTSFGDQGIAVRKDFYASVGGFPQWHLFEDVEFLRRVRKLTRINSLSAHVTTSAKRFLERGLLRQQIKNGWLLVQYLLGASTEKLSREYNS